MWNLFEFCFHQNRRPLLYFSMFHAVIYRRPLSYWSTNQDKDSYPGPCQRLLGGASVGHSCRWHPGSSPSPGWWCHSSGPSPGSLDSSHFLDGCSSPPVSKKYKQNCHCEASIYKYPKRWLLLLRKDYFWLSISKISCNIFNWNRKRVTSFEIQ